MTVRKQDIQIVVSDFDKILQQDYGLTLTDVANDPGTRTRRISHAVGVYWKKDISNLKSMRMKSAPSGYNHKWIIDPAKIESMPIQSWQIQMLVHTPSRSPGESVADLATRLKHETEFGRAFRAVLHSYICSDRKTLEAVDKALKEAGLGAVSGLFNPRQLVSASGMAIAAALAPALSTLPAMAIAAGVVVVATLGMKAICPDWKSNKEMSNNDKSGKATAAVSSKPAFNTKRRAAKKSRN